MTLALLAILVVVGVSLVVALVHFSGGSVTATITDDYSALERFMADFPDIEAPLVFLSRDRKTALVLNSRSNQIGLVTTMGANLVTREPGFAIKHVTQSASDNIEIELDDLTLSRVVFACKDEEQANRIMKYLNIVLAGGH